MSDLIYASIDENNICISITEYFQALHSPPSNMVALDSMDTSIVGKKWSGSTWEEIPKTVEEIEFDARGWRESELFRTDSLMLLDDYPQKDGLRAYRQELRDWPSTSEFPSGTKPTLGS